MDYNNPPPSWVEHAVIEMRQSQTYRDRIVDEWYETLPIPAWSVQPGKSWIVVGFGKNARPSGPMGPVRSSPPHITCTLSYPDGAQRWSSDTAGHAWPSSKDAKELVLPMPAAGSLMERRRRYYNALSDALSRGAFEAGRAPYSPAACVAAHETRDTFLLAATFPNLAPIYAGVLAQMDGWLRNNCSGR